MFALICLNTRNTYACCFDVWTWTHKRHVCLFPLICLNANNTYACLLWYVSTSNWHMLVCFDMFEHEHHVCLFASIYWNVKTRMLVCFDTFEREKHACMFALIWLKAKSTCACLLWYVWLFMSNNTWDTEEVYIYIYIFDVSVVGCGITLRAWDTWDATELSDLAEPSKTRVITAQVPLRAQNLCSSMLLTRRSAQRGCSGMLLCHRGAQRNKFAHASEPQWRAAVHCNTDPCLA